MEQTGSDFSASVFEHGKALAEIERSVAALSALLVKWDDHSSSATEPSQSAQQLVSGHVEMNRTLGHRGQAVTGHLVTEAGRAPGRRRARQRGIVLDRRGVPCARLAGALFRRLQLVHDRYKVAEIEHAADCVVWCCDEAPGFVPGRPQDRTFVGNIVEAIEAYGRGALGPVAIPLSAASRSAPTA
jgi:hypothetical protein